MTVFHTDPYFLKCSTLGDTLPGIPLGLSIGVLDVPTEPYNSSAHFFRGKERFGLVFALRAPNHRGHSIRLQHGADGGQCHVLQGPKGPLRGLHGWN